jgi:hypothetical protein
VNTFDWVLVIVVGGAVALVTLLGLGIWYFGAMMSDK